MRRPILTESSNWRKLQTFGVGGVACEVSQMVQQAQGQANHGLALGYDLGPAPEAGGAVPSVAVAPSDGDRQPLDGEHLVDGTTRWQPSRSSVTKALPGSLRQQAASSRPPRTHATMRRLPRPSARPTQSLASFFPGHATSRPSRPCPLCPRFHRRWLAPHRRVSEAAARATVALVLAHRFSRSPDHRTACSTVDL